MYIFGSEKRPKKKCWFSKNVAFCAPALRPIQHNRIKLHWTNSIRSKYLEQKAFSMTFCPHLNIIYSQCIQNICVDYPTVTACAFFGHRTRDKCKHNKVHSRFIVAVIFRPLYLNAVCSERARWHGRIKIWYLPDGLII